MNNKIISRILETFVQDTNIKLVETLLIWIQICIITQCPSPLPVTYRHKYQKPNNFQIWLHAYPTILHVHIQTFPHNQPTLVPSLLGTSINPSQKWQWTILKIKISSKWCKGSPCTQADPILFFWVMRAGRDFSPDVRTCFHQVPKRSQRAPQVPKLFHHDVPSSTSVLSHMLSPQFNFHGSNLGKGNWLGHSEPAPTSFLLGSSSPS